MITYLEVLDKLSIEEDPAIILQVDFEPSWIDSLVNYLSEEKLLENKNKAWRIKN